jgi:hypothetical protein
VNLPSLLVKWAGCGFVFRKTVAALVQSSAGQLAQNEVEAYKRTVNELYLNVEQILFFGG